MPQYISPSLIFHRHQDIPLILRYSATTPYPLPKPLPSEGRLDKLHHFYNRIHTLVNDPPTFELYRYSS